MFAPISRSAPKSLCCSTHTHPVWAKPGRKRLGGGGPPPGHGALYAKHRVSGKARFLTDFLGEVYEFSLKFKWPGVQTSDVRVAVFANYQGGWCWISPQDMYLAMGLAGKGGNVAKWVQSKLSAWEKRLRELGLESSHCRRALPTGNQDDDIGRRVLTYATLSATATLAIVANLAGGARNFGGPTSSDERQKAVAMTHGLVAEIAVPKFRLRLNCELRAQHIGRECLGDAPLWLQATDNIADLSEVQAALADYDSPFLQLLLSGRLVDFDFLASAAAMPLAELLIELLRRGPVLQWMAKQVVWQLGDLLDTRLSVRLRPTTMELLGDDSPVKQSLVDKAGSQTVVPLTDTADKGSHWRCRRLRLHRYCMAGREVFEGAKNMSISIDAARAAKRKISAIAWCLPSNDAFWAPPQAARAPTSGGQKSAFRVGVPQTTS